MTRNRESSEELRERARSEAESELRERGFVIESDGVWAITLNLGSFGDLPGRAVLPAEFPDELPVISIDRTTLPRRVPHVEKSGKICLAPSTGVLLDATAPRQLIQDSLNRAQDILIDGLSGKNENDLLEEFSAYWNADVGGSVASICEVSGESRVIDLIAMVQPGDSKRSMNLAADEFAIGKIWAERGGWKISKRDEAFFIKIERTFEPPDFEESISTNELFAITLQSASSESSEQMKRWLWTKRLPAYVLMSIPLQGDQGWVVIAARMEAAVGKAKQQAQKGFRPGHIPAAIETRFTRETPVTRILVRRLDSNYLLTRGGADNKLLSRTIAIVGCGAIGSNIARDLASLGVGRIRIVDPDILMPENIHRHVLGMSFLDMNKADGMKQFLNRHFPHLNIEARAERIQHVLEREPEFITGADLLIIALGDETLELRLNQVLGNQMPRIHVWVEPLGLGGHVLATGLNEGGGCFRCLFETDSVLGIHNQSAFAAPGQKFQPAFSGCAGTFTPFAGIDAERASIEASTLASLVLLEEGRQNKLISWRGQDTSFVNAGFRLSKRGEMFEIGERRIEDRFARVDCIDCGEYPA
jgi:molybdopterin/thiamine biosynthesis adenylyltransferase